MGMVMGLTSVRDATIERLLADPPLVWKLLAPDDPEPYQDARREFGPGAGDEALELGEGEGEELHLDKAWHGIHYLLTGTAWEGGPPLDLLVSGGHEVGEIDVGYGTPRAVRAEIVAAASHALAALSDQALRSRFDPHAMLEAEIYPAIWARPPGEDDTLGYLMEYVAELRPYLARLAAAGLGVVVSLS